MLELLEIFWVSMDRGLCGVYLKNELPNHHEPNVAHQSQVIIFSMFFPLCKPSFVKDGRRSQPDWFEVRTLARSCHNHNGPKLFHTAGCTKVSLE